MFEGITSSLQNVFRKIGGSGTLTEKNLGEITREIRLALIEADVNYQVAKDFCAKIKEDALGQQVIESVQPEQQFIKIVHDGLVELLGGETQPLKFHSNRATVIMMVGLNGAGKTTTSAKLALLLRKKFDKDPLLCAADLARPAAIEQLATLGAQLNVPVHREEPKGTTPPKVCKNAVDFANRSGHDIVILDTAGRLQLDDALMTELEEVKKQVKPDYIFLVVDGMTGQDAVNSAKGFNDRLDIDDVILTKLDGDTRGGAALSIKQVTQKPIRFVGVGEKPENFEEFHADRMAGRILGRGDIVSLVEMAQQNIQQDEAEQQMNKLLAAEFTFDDFLEQLRMIKRMGSLKDLMKKLPAGMLGMDAAALDDLDDDQLKYTEAMILSMTLRERRFPDTIDKPRRFRISRGSGCSIAQVNELLKSFKAMQRQMKEMRESGMLGKLAGRRMESKKYKALEKERKRRKIKKR